MTPDQNRPSLAEPQDSPGGKDNGQVQEPAAMPRASLPAFASISLDASLAPGHGAFGIAGREETETARVRRLTFEKLDRSVTQISPKTTVHTGTRSRLFSLPSHHESQGSRSRSFVSRVSSSIHDPTTSPRVVPDPEERMLRADRNAEMTDHAGNKDVVEDARSDCLLM